MLLGNIYVSGWKRAQKKFSTVYGFWKSYRRKFVRHLIKRQNIKRVKRSANYQFFSLGAAHLWSLQKRTWSGNRTRTRTGLRNMIWANTRISTLRKHKFHDVMSWCFRIFPHIFLYEDTFHMLYNVPSHLFLTEGPITSLSNCQLDSPQREHLKGTKARRVDKDAVLLGEHKHGRAGGQLCPSPPWDSRSTRKRWHSRKFCTLYLKSTCNHKQWKNRFILRLCLMFIIVK